MYAHLDPAPRRIVVKEVNWLGDLVMSLPALRAIRRSFPNAALAIVVRKELAGFFDGMEWIDEVIPYSVAKGWRGMADRWSIVKEVRMRRFDLAILFPRSFESALWMTLAGVPRRAGYVGDGRSAMLTHRTVPPPHTMTGHQVHYWLAMVRNTAGASGNAQDFELRPDAAKVEAMRAWLARHRRNAGSRTIAMAPTAAYGPAKEWPAIHFARLIDELAESHDIECVLVGAPSELQRCREVADVSHHGAMVAAGETGVGELVALLSIVDGFVGNDSGAMHVAAALGRPTVGIFGSTNPERTGPMGPKTRVLWRHLECSPCLQRTCRFGHYNCLVEITPESAIAALRSLSVVG